MQGIKNARNYTILKHFMNYSSSYLYYSGLIYILPTYLVKTFKLVQDTIDLSSTSSLFLESLDFVVFIDYCLDPWQQKTFLKICENIRNTAVKQFEGNEISEQK